MTIFKEIKIDITIEDIVKAFSHTYSNDQAKIINLMAKEFKTFGACDKDGMQMLSIKEDLTKEGKEFIKKLYEYTK